MRRAALLLTLYARAGEVGGNCTRELCAGWPTQGVAGSLHTLPPVAFKAASGDARVVDRVLRVSVPQIVLHRSQIYALVGQIQPA